MHRIKDYYGWDNLENWKTAVDHGAVKIRKEQYQADDKILYQAIRMLLINCLPVSLICKDLGQDGLELLITPLWNGIFAFIYDKRKILYGNQRIVFSQMKQEEQKQILRANISTIWIKE